MSDLDAAVAEAITDLERTGAKPDEVARAIAQIESGRRWEARLNGQIVLFPDLERLNADIADVRRMIAEVEAED